MAAASLTFCGCDNNNEGEEEIQTTDTPLVLTGKNYSFDPKAAGAEWKKRKEYRYLPDDRKWRGDNKLLRECFV